MKTKVLAALVATMAVGATCAFAANPFVDVPTDSWAYKSDTNLRMIETKFNKFLTAGFTFTL